MTGGGGNSTALVGTPETVAAALLDYYDLGIHLLSARGYDIYDDAIDFGRYVIPLVRDEVAKRDAALAAKRARGRHRPTSPRSQRRSCPRPLIAGQHSCPLTPPSQRTLMTTTVARQELFTAWESWHAARELDLQEEHGWLSITGFHWLQPVPTEVDGLPGRWSFESGDAVLRGRSRRRTRAGGRIRCRCSR